MFPLSWFFFPKISGPVMAFLSVYQPRERKASPLWQIFYRCNQEFEDGYEEKFEKRFGFFRAKEIQEEILKLGIAGI